jgi:hypothetical protein
VVGVECPILRRIQVVVARGLHGQREIAACHQSSPGRSQECNATSVRSADNVRERPPTRQRPQRRPADKWDVVVPPDWRAVQTRTAACNADAAGMRSHNVDKLPTPRPRTTNRQVHLMSGPSRCGHSETQWHFPSSGCVGWAFPAGPQLYPVRASVPTLPGQGPLSLSWHPRRVTADFDQRWGMPLDRVGDESPGSTVLAVDEGLPSMSGTGSPRVNDPENCPVPRVTRCRPPQSGN